MITIKRISREESLMRFKQLAERNDIQSFAVIAILKDGTFERGAHADTVSEYETLLDHLSDAYIDIEVEMSLVSKENRSS